MWSYVKKQLSKLADQSRNWKFLTIRRLLYLPQLLPKHERRFIGLLFLVFLISGLGLVTRSYVWITKPVPEVGGSYSEGLLKEPRTINPLYASQDTDRDFTRLVFSRILTYNHNGELEMDLADKYEISENGKEYRVYLKKDVKWHDNKPLTADDILFTIKTIQNPQYKSILRANWLGVTVEKLDKYTIKFILKSSYSPFLENLTVGILPKHLWESVTPDQAILHELNLKPIGSGAYRFSQIKQNKDGTVVWYKLERNKNYYRPGPYLKNLKFIFYKTEEEAVAALRKGIIEGFGPLSAKYLDSLDRHKISVFSLAMPRIFGLFFNQKDNDLLKDQYVREAIAYAINKDSLTNNSSGGAVAADSLLPFLKKDSPEDSYKYNPEKSKQILAKDGWKDTDGDGFLNKKANSKDTKNSLVLRLKLTTSDWPDLLKTADMIKKDLNEVGIDLVVETRTLAELEKDVIRPRNFDILLFGQVYGFEPDPYAFWHSSQLKDPGLNVSLYTNKKADKILEDSRHISDQNQRNKKFKELDAILTADLPAIPLYYQLYLYLLPADMQGVNLARISLPADRFNDIAEWYLETQRVLR